MYQCHLCPMCDVKTSLYTVKISSISKYLDFFFYNVSVNFISFLCTSNFSSVLECPHPNNLTKPNKVEVVNHTGLYVDSILTVECQTGNVIQNSGGLYRKNLSCLINETEYAEWEGFDNIACEGGNFIHFNIFCIFSVLFSLQ